LVKVRQWLCCADIVNVDKKYFSFALHNCLRYNQ